MNSAKKTARSVSALFIIAFAFNALAMAIYEPILNAPDYLVSAYPHKIQVIMGLLLELMCVPAIVLIPVMLFPILKQHNERIALAYVGFRFLEVVFHIAPVINSLSVLSLSREYVNSGASDVSYFQILGNAIQAENHWSTLIYIVVFTLGALMFYKVLFQSKLLPQFISVWGFLAATLLLMGALCGFFGLIPLSQIMLFFGPPVALNEMTLAAWLIIKGFNLSAVNSESGQQINHV
jgi:hypothetical protein